MTTAMHRFDRKGSTDRARRKYERTTSRNAAVVRVAEEQQCCAAIPDSLLGRDHPSSNNFSAVALLRSFPNTGIFPRFEFFQDHAATALNPRPVIPSSQPRRRVLGNRERAYTRPQ
jgi:hypothetical protein